MSNTNVEARRETRKTYDCQAIFSKGTREDESQAAFGVSLGAGGATGAMVAAQNALSTSVHCGYSWTASLMPPSTHSQLLYGPCGQSDQSANF
jgi:hypothetical protein